MPRPTGRFTYDATLGRFRNAAGQLVPDNAILGTAIALTVSHEDALEMLHDGHVAGAAGPEWIKEMRKGLQQPCVACGVSVGLADVTLSGEHTRDWGKSR